MFDIHRHLPIQHEVSLPQDWQIWFATSSPSEWETLATLPHNPLWKHGYGLSSQWLSTNSASLPELDNYIEKLTELLQADPLGYLGEFGIDDRYIENFPLTKQISLAKRLLHIASEFGRPAVMHHVGTTTTLFALLDAVPITKPIIIHGFLGSVETGRQLHQRGCYISLGPRVWIQKTRIKKRLHEFDIPFCLETDFPFVPGKIAGPADYEIILKNHYKQIAQMLKIEVEILEERIDGLTSILTYW